jgi:oxygen-independent coproporphyrinogen-3 oxidase
VKIADAIRVITRDGVSLGLWRARAPDAPRKAIPLLLVHGTFSNRNFFGAPHGLGFHLAARGYDVWVAELRGLGRSGEAGQARWDVEDWIVHDVPALLEGVRKATGSERVVWIGHSAGAVVAAGAAGRSAEVAASIAGLVLVAAPAPDRPGIANAAVSLLGNAVANVMGRVPARALGIGPADEAPGILRQWCEWIVRRRWVGHDGLDYLAEARRLTAPALGLVGAADLLTPPATCRRLLDALGGADRTMVVCGRSQGFSENYTHNRVLISSAARQEVWPLIADWLEERF